MEPLCTFSELVKEMAERGKARLDDPAFRQHAAEGAAQDAEAAARSREIERHNALLRAGVPMRFWTAQVKPNETPALRAVWKFLEAPLACSFLTLCGPRGRGKSFAASWAVGEFGGLYVPNAQDLVFDGVYAPVWQEMRSARVLAIDEVGAEYRNDAYAAQLYATLNARHLDQRKTVLVSNLDAEGFKARLLACGLDRLLERLVQDGMFEPLPGESMRTHWSEPGGTP